jgi:hypothetical protein
MKLSIFSLSVLAIIACSTSAKAQNYPWCAQYGGGMGGATNCGFTTFQQCLDNIRGLGGFCNPNTQYVPPSGPRTRARQ